MKELILYRKRLIPEECTLLKDDEILFNDCGVLVTRWKALRPRKDLHHGLSCYYLKEGYKISRFYGADGRLLYHYCDIIASDLQEDSGSLVVTDLLADVIVYPDGTVRVVDLDEICHALDRGLLRLDQLKSALSSLSSLLERIYNGKLSELTAPIEQFDPLQALPADRA